MFLAAFFLFTVTPAHAEEATWEYSVQVSATVQSSPPRILLTWPQDTVLSPSSYTVYRKSLTDADWGAGTVLDGSTTSFLDTSVPDGQAYEYQIVKVTSAYTGYGYIYAGIEAPLTEARGTVVLIVDNTYADALGTRLARLQQDLAGDGWTVLRHDVSPSDPVTYIKSLIQNDYYFDPVNVNTVFLFGHVPVPYSGDIVPDEHIPDHQGAWPADVYYADMNGTWTDNSVNDTGADNSRNWNVPGDGKFDQSYPPGPVQLMVGRVDLSNLPGQTSWDGPPTLPDEQSLLANYLDKDHNFRQKVFDLPRRGIIGNYFGDFYGEAFAASGWRNFAPFFGHDNITDLPNEGTWMPTLSSQAYLWSYGCGAGGPDSIAGLGNDSEYHTAITPDFYAADIRSVFVMLFGSWFGDWDSPDDLMRGVLATPTYSLACMWSGSPQWFCHHMALGQTLGFSTRLTQNNTTNGLYRTEVEPFAGMIHVALMGDPTLRMHVVGPPANLLATDTGSGVALSWSPSSDTILGYHVYRSANPTGPFTRINSQLLTDHNFTDPNPGGGSPTYMVRAVKLENTPSGTYYNASQGIFSTLSVGPPPTPVVTVLATVPNASRLGSTPGVFTLTRTGDTSAGLIVNFSLGGTATSPADFKTSPTATNNSLTIPSGASSITLTINPQPSPTWVGPQTVTLTLEPPGDSTYSVGAQNTAAINIHGNNVQGITLTISNSIAILGWPAAPGRTYHVAYETNLNGTWTDFGVNIPGANGKVFWHDPNPARKARRYYRVFETQ